MKFHNLAHGILFVVIFLIVFIVPALSQDEAPRREGWFYADEHPEVVESLQVSEFSDGVLSALADAGQNWVELWEALDIMVGQHREDACWLVANMPHLDRLEMDNTTLQEHVNFAWVTKSDLPYRVPPELFREYILTYRIGDEPVRAYRSYIWWEYGDLVGDTPSETAKNINNWVHENIEIRERGFFGPRPDPVSIIKAGSGTTLDVAIVAIAMCKTFGVPARRARIEILGEQEGGKTWLEVYSDGQWLPMYPDNPDAFGDFGYIESGFPRNVTLVRVESAFSQEQVTGNYSETGMVTVNFIRNGEYVPDYEHFTLSAWNDGAWLPIDDIWYATNQPGEDGFTSVLGNGFYVVQVGVRNSRGDAWVQTAPVMVEPGGHEFLEFNLDIPASESSRVELIHRMIDPLPDNAAVDALNDGLYTCLIIFDPTTEPSIRTSTPAAEWCNSNEASMVAVGVCEETEAHAFFDDLGASGSTIPDPDGTITKSFGIEPNNEGAWPRLPLVILFSPDNEIILLQEGLNLSIDEQMSRAVELYEVE